MKAYEKGSGAYFATPPVNLIYAFHASLSAITKGSPSLADRFKLHREASKRVKDAAAALGLKQVPLEPAFASNGMTAVRSLIYKCQLRLRLFHSFISRMA
jgi:alanine-glyoxylate transaminase / serine-glyoxylate transaminase / serine-pyruvate transaminase